MKIRNQTPKGGTELQFEYLEKYVDKKLLDQVQITTSIPEKISLHPTKVNILWQKNSYSVFESDESTKFMFTMIADDASLFAQ